MSSKISRKHFLRNTGAATAGFMIVPSSVFGSKFGKIAPTDKLNIAGVGVGGMGFANLKRMETENIVALTDVDWDYTAKNGVFDRYPKAKKYYDFRQMYDEMGKSIDAVVVATADHTHAIVAAYGMELNKHMYVQKPLTHSVYESRLLTNLAKKYKVATQMGNQGASGVGVRQVCDWIWNGEIGTVKRVDVFTDRPIWPQGLSRPEPQEKPKNLDWEGFIGPAPMRPYNSIYTPWNWRGWWDFGTGALGDMACHMLHPVFKGLNLGYPTQIQGSSTMLLSESAPNAEYVKYTFPARKGKGSIAQYPAVDVYWYDGGLQPERPKGVPAGKNLNDSGGGVIFYGTKDTLICGCYGVNPWLVSGRKPTGKKWVNSNLKDSDHEQDWIRACKESPSSRKQTTSPFSEAGPFNEMVVLGVAAIRLQSLNQVLNWDGPNMKFTNIPAGAKIRTIIKDGFRIHDGHPTFDKTWTEPVDANAFAEELIKHTYRPNWNLPAMP